MVTWSSTAERPYSSPDAAKCGVARVGPWEAGDPIGPHPRLRVGSQGGMPTRSPPEAGLAGDELRKSPWCGTPFCPIGGRYVNRVFGQSLAEVAEDPVKDAAVAEIADLV